MGPDSACEARTRASFSADRQRANTASVTSELGTPRSSASWLIHLPVPLAPALSMIRSTMKAPVSGSLTLKMSRVISIR